MRHRRRDWQTQLLEQEFDFYIKEPSQFKGKWKQNFDALHVEIGSGKGQYVIEMAKKYPNKLFVGVERMPLIGAYILRELSLNPLKNVCVIIDHAQEISEWFEPNEIDVIHLNFSDPWPKKAHVKRRLTYPGYLEIYQKLLSKQGELHLKTDNEQFFEYSTLSLSQFGATCRDFSVNFRRETNDFDALTEYEQRFMSKGQPIYRSVWTFSHDLRIDKSTN